MTVYVDDMYQYPLGQFRGMKMSHMIADTLDELHAMAKRIGIARRHFQDKHSGPHYDVAMSKRADAIKAGAVPVELRTLSRMCFVARITGKLPKPDNAEVEWQACQQAMVLRYRKHKAELKKRDRQTRKFYAYRARVQRENRAGLYARF